MKLTMTDKITTPSLMLGIYGQPKIGKTLTLATALNLGGVLHLSSPGEGKAASSLQDYPINHISIENYRDLMVVEAVLLGKPAGWFGDDVDPPVARLKDGITQGELDTVSKFIADQKIATVAIDGLVSFQDDIFGGQSIAFWGKDTGVGRYGDIAELTRLHMQRFAGMQGMKLVVVITHDAQVSDTARGGVQLGTIREMAFVGRASRDIIPAMLSFILPVFPASHLGEQFKPWKCSINGTEETRDRYFTLTSYDGYWGGGRMGINTQLQSIRADLTHFYNTFTKKEAK